MLRATTKRFHYRTDDGENVNTKSNRDKVGNKINICQNKSKIPNCENRRQNNFLTEKYLQNDKILKEEKRL